MTPKTLAKAVATFFGLGYLPVVPATWASAAAVLLEIMGRDSAKAYVSKGLGLSILNSYYITPSDSKKIKCVDVSEYFGQTKRGIIQRKGRALSQFHNILIESIISEARSKAEGRDPL